MNTLWRDRTIALAGLTMPVQMVDELARSGYLNTSDFETCVSSLFEQNPKSVEDVFGGSHKLLKGFETLQNLLENGRSGPRNNQLLGYSLGILHLQKKLLKKSHMLDEIGERLEKARHQLDHFGPSHDNLIANLADIYTQTISTFQFRIQVLGEYQYLQQNRVANQVRVLLFAAIRSATLWRQLGGSRWQLLLQRKHIVEHNQKLLDEAKRTTLH